MHPFPSRRAQGAMEYLMTYGWAILVVMIVGVVFWELGVFNMGTSAFTAKGFTTIKPQLATVDMYHFGNGGYHFLGTFVNLQGTDIDITDASVLFPGKTCRNAYVENLDGQTGSFMMTCMPGAISVPVKKGDHFKVFAEICVSDCMGTWDDAYQQTNEVEIEFTYNTRVGGLQVTRKANGVIRGPIRPT
ncbi:MAG: hypothetical protein ABH950_02645 [Candidatus Altiarchaeota archaeon]